MAVLWPLAPWLARGLNLEGEAFAVAVRYLRVDGLGQVVTAMSLAGFAALRGAGDMTTPMWLGAATNLVNAAASWAFVYGVEPLGLAPQGADGIVFGTVTARVFGGAALIAVLAGGVTRLRLVASQLMPDAETTRRVLAIGVPAAFDGAVRWAGHYAFMALISRLGSDGEGEVVFAAHVVAVRLEAITYLPAMAWGAAAATLVGQGLGGNRVGRARSGWGTSRRGSARCWGRRSPRPSCCSPRRWWGGCTRAKRCGRKPPRRCGCWGCSRSR